ncbi:MAG: hypothetical protein AAFV07_04130 [Bacteroidota bacterium]
MGLALMDFSREDIARLYGSRLFILSGEGEAAVSAPVEEKAEATAPEPPKPAPEPVVEKVPTPPEPKIQEPTLLVEGFPAVWKMKREAKLALILHEEEFKNKDLTSRLKNMVVEAGIPTGEIGFGVIQTNATSLDLRDMPVEKGIIFGPPPGVGSSPAVWRGKTWYLTHKLATASDPDAQAHMQNTLKALLSQS